MSLSTQHSEQKIVAFMPLRGGSKSIPYKNIRTLSGKPLFYWSLKSAIDSGIFRDVYVSTDDERIAASVRQHLPAAIVVNRPPETATDDATTESAMLHFAGVAEFDVMCLIQATSPLTRAADFSLAWQKFNDDGLDSMATGVQWKRFFWTHDGQPVNYDPQRRPRRQDFEGWIMENGAFYFTRREILLRDRCRLGGRMGIFEMPDDTALEIDEPSDWLIIENLLKQRTAAEGADKQLCDMKSIRALVLDVDGTLTDGGMYYGESGEALKKFNTKDAQGMKLLQAAGLIVCVITAEDSPRVHARMKKLEIDEYYPGIKDKLPLLQSLCERWGISLPQVAYVGDDCGDVECIRAAGFGACPSDGETVALRVSDYVTRRNAGAGAVREVCDMILAAKR